MSKGVLSNWSADGNGIPMGTGIACQAAGRESGNVNSAVEMGVTCWCVYRGCH